MGDEQNGTSTGVWRGMVAEKLANIEVAVGCLPKLCDRVTRLETCVKVQWWMIGLIVTALLAFAVKTVTNIMNAVH